MDQIRSIWKFVCKNREHLDCELISATKTFLTNKCFLFSINSSLLQGLSSSGGTEGNLKIIMSEFSEQEIIDQLYGFVFHGDQDKDELKWPNGIEQTKTSKQHSVKQKYIREPSKSNLERNCHICDLCGKEFAASKQLWMHQFQVHRGSNHQCTVCLKNYKTSLILQSHVREVHEGQKFCCIKCQKVECIKFYLY